MAGINLAAFRKAMDDKGSQTLKGNGAAPPTPTRDKPTVTPSKKQLSDARQKAIANLGAKGAANSPARLALRNANAAERASMKSHPHKGDDTAEDSGRVDSPLGRRLPQSGKKNPFLRVN